MTCAGHSMNILFLAHRMPYPPDKGDKLRSFHELQRLAERHAVYLACFVDDPEDFRHADVTARLCVQQALIPWDRRVAAIRGLFGMLTGGTLTEGAFSSRRMSDQLRRWQSTVDFDAVVAFSSCMAPYASSVRASRRILDMCDLDSRKWTAYATQSWNPRHWLYRMEGKRLARRELDWVRSFDATLLISDHEAADLPQPERARVTIVGNGVAIPPRASAHESERPVSPGMTKARPAVGFVGMMNYRPNIDAVTWFVREVWPAVHARRPDAEFRIIGRHPSTEVERLAGVPGVSVVGGVDLIEPELAGLTCSVAPLRIARGVQNKVLEAMAHAIPVVATPQAAQGIRAKPGRHLLLSAGADGFARAVIDLLNNEAKRHEIGTAGRDHVASAFRWDSVLERFERVVCGLPVNAFPASQHRDESVTGNRNDWEPYAARHEFSLSERSDQGFSATASSLAGVAGDPADGST